MPDQKTTGKDRAAINANFRHNGMQAGTMVITGDGTFELIAAGGALFKEVGAEGAPRVLHYADLTLPVVLDELQVDDKIARGEREKPTYHKK